jgi:hypothetical protein
MINKSILLLSLFFIICSTTVVAQDHHYWTQQFGSRSALMGGAVVGGVRDTSAGFYNPGALGFVKEPTLSVSANAYQLERLSIGNGFGTGEELSSDQIGVIPLLASGTLILERFPEHTFGYTLLTKTQSSFSASGRVDKTLNIGDFTHQDGTVSFPGDENYIGQLIVENETTEFWGGLTWAYQIRPNISVGTTVFLAFRNQSQNESIRVRAVNDDVMSTSDIINYIDFWHIRSLLKLGVAAEFEPFKLGLTVTTPSINIFGQGTVAAEESFNNFYDPTTDQLTGILASDRQENLDTTYQSPFSIALGAEIQLTKATNLGLAVEWFAQQGEYDVFTPGSHTFLRDVVSPVIDLTSGQTTLDGQSLIQVKDAADEVFNVGVAVEHVFNERVRGYFSFRTDQESNPEIATRSLGIANWDIYHLTIGTITRRKRSELAVGLTYSFGEQEQFQQFANFSNLNQGQLVGDNQETTAKFRAFSLLVGYTYFFDINQ